MASRQDVELTYVDSPRVAEVAAPSTDINMQDLVDTLRAAEYSWEGNTSKKLINASGKEDLGGGVFVGITAALQNLLLSFEGRTTPAETGTVTSNPGSAIAGRDQFGDTAALFQTNLVQRGSLVINFTDRSVAEVVSVDSEILLTTKTLVNGIGNTYDVADVYHVFNIIQCKADGGNLVAVDDLQATIALSGTKFPIGTPRVPVDNFTDALVIAATNGFERILVHDNATLPNDGNDFTRIVFLGRSTSKTTITIPASTNVTDCEFEDCTIVGTLDGASYMRRCILNGVTDINGALDDCGLVGNLFLQAGGMVQMINCYSGVGGGSEVPIINIGTCALLGRDYSGGVHFKGKISTAPLSWDMDSGQVVVDNDCTLGAITLRGVAKWLNSASYLGGSRVVNELLNGQELQTLRKLMQNKMVTDPITGIMTIYEDDSATVLLRGNIFEDVLAAQIYRGRGIERRDRLALVTDTFAAEFGPEFD